MKLLKILAAMILGAIALVVALLAGFYFGTEWFFDRTYKAKLADFDARPNKERLARGEHLVTALLDCGGCHGDDLGGQVVVDDLWVGRIVAPNLTSGEGGLALGYGEKDWARAVRHAIASDGRGLALMPSDAMGELSDEDLEAVVAHLRDLPPVDREISKGFFGPGGRVLLLTGGLPYWAPKLADKKLDGQESVEPDDTRVYGRYLAQIGGCYACHGEKLEGKQVGKHHAPALRAAALDGWTQDDFDTLLERGATYDGRDLPSDLQGHRAFGKLTKTERKALWAWLKHAASKS